MTSTSPASNACSRSFEPRISLISTSSPASVNLDFGPGVAPSLATTAGIGAAEVVDADDDPPPPASRLPGGAPARGSPVAARPCGAQGSGPGCDKQPCRSRHQHQRDQALRERGQTHVPSGRVQYNRSRRPPKWRNRRTGTLASAVLTGTIVSPRASVATSAAIFFARPADVFIALVREREREQILLVERTGTYRFARGFASMAVRRSAGTVDSRSSLV